MNVSLLDEVAAGRAPPIERLTVDQLHRMLEYGILSEGAPIELIDGVLVRKDRSDCSGDQSMHGPRHAFCLERCQRLRPCVEAHGCHLRTQLPLSLSEYHAPEPDASIVRGIAEDYHDRHPGPRDVLAALEIAASSLTFDRTTKCAVYAAAGIPVYWIINLADREIEVYEAPLPGERRYGRMAVFKEDDIVALPLGGGHTLDIAVSDLLP